MGDSAEILYQSFQREVIEGRTDMGRDVHSLTLSTEHFLCRPRRRNRLPPPLPPTPNALKNGFGEAIVACDLPEPCGFPSLKQLPEEISEGPQGS